MFDLSAAVTGWTVVDIYFDRLSLIGWSSTPYLLSMHAVRLSIQWRSRRARPSEKMLCGQITVNSSKNREKVSVCFGKKFYVKMHVFFMFFISRLKMHARCVSWARVWVWGENYLGTSQAVWEHRYLCYESGAGVWSEGSLGFRVMVKNLSPRFCLDSATMS